MYSVRGGGGGSKQVPEVLDEEEAQELEQAAVDSASNSCRAVLLARIVGQRRRDLL